MAKNKLALSKKRIYAEGGGPLSTEEKRVISYYRSLGRWDRNALHILMQGIAWGHLTDKTDRLPWPKLARLIGLPKETRRA